MNTARVLLADDHAPVACGHSLAFGKDDRRWCVDIAIPGLNGVKALVPATKEFYAVKVTIVLHDRGWSRRQFAADM